MMNYVNYTKQQKIIDEITIWLESNNFTCEQPASGMINLYARRGKTKIAVIVKPKYRSKISDLDYYLNNAKEIARCPIILVGSYDEFVKRSKRLSINKQSKTRTVEINGRKLISITKGKVK